MLLASSHGYSTINYIRTYSWMKNTFSAGFKMETWSHSVSWSLDVLKRPFRAADVLRLTHYTVAFSTPAPWVVFTLRSYNFHDLDKWVGLLDIWEYSFLIRLTVLFSRLSLNVRHGAEFCTLEEVMKEELDKKAWVLKSLKLIAM